MFLTHAELYELTGRRRRDAQGRQLTRMGIIHKVRADGGIVVLESHVENLLGGTIKKTVRHEQAEPDLGGIC